MDSNQQPTQQPAPTMPTPVQVAQTPAANATPNTPPPTPEPKPTPTPIVSATIPEPVLEDGQLAPGVEPRPPITASGPSATAQPSQTAPGVAPQPSITATEPNPIAQTGQQVSQPTRAEQIRSSGQARRDTGGVKKTLNTAQKSLLISEIRDNMVIMNDGSFRAVIVCQSINFDLMSEDERAGIEFSYQNFLNSLYFDIQVSVSSRRVDLSDYIEKLEGIRREQDNLLLGRLTDSYLDFIFDISQRANLMRKSFLIVVPFYIGGDVSSDTSSLKNIRANLFESSAPAQIKISADNYAKAKEEISNRVNVVLSGMTSIGIQAGQLPTKALAELYYNFYNPDTAVNQPLGDFKNYVGNIVTKKGEGTAPGFQEVVE